MKKNVFPHKTSIDTVGAVYNEMIASVRQLYEKISKEKELDIENVCRLMEKLINNVSTAEDEIVFLTSNIYLEDHLLYHIVNVTILSIKLGMHLKYPHQSIVDLGVFALLHGMNDPEEGYAAQELKGQKFIQKFIQAKQIKENFVKEVLGIISVLDVYESLTHNRAYRSRFMPYEVLRAIISAAEQVFNPKIVKEIINVFSIYPLGTTVRLNTEEVAEVIKINIDFPLRPQVVILADNHGNKLEEKKTIDLAANRNIYIKEPLTT